MGTVAELQSARIMHGHLCREPQTTIDEEPTQQGRDGVVPVVRIISCPPMADAVGASGFDYDVIRSLVVIKLVARWSHRCAGHHKKNGLQRTEVIREYKCPADALWVENGRAPFYSF